jgi:hypothetical protein
MPAAGRIAAAAKAIHHAEWTDGGFRELDAETCWAQDPDDHQGYYEQVQIILTAADGWDREAHIVRVCSNCYSSNLDGAQHRTSVPDGPEDGRLACLWPCRHEVGLMETDCRSCHPIEAPF